MVTKPEILRWKSIDNGRLAAHVKWIDKDESYEGLSHVVYDITCRDTKLYDKLRIYEYLWLSSLFLSLIVHILNYPMYLFAVFFMIAMYTLNRRNKILGEYAETDPTALLITCMLDGEDEYYDLLYKGSDIRQLISTIDTMERYRPTIDYKKMFDE